MSIHRYKTLTEQFGRDDLIVVFSSHYVGLTAPAFGDKFSFMARIMIPADKDSYRVHKEFIFGERIKLFGEELDMLWGSFDDTLEFGPTRYLTKNVEIKEIEHCHERVFELLSEEIEPLRKLMEIRGAHRERAREYFGSIF